MRRAKRPILIIEDDEPIRTILGEILRDAGYETAQAANGREALELLDHGCQPSLILLDIMMPVMDGWEFARALHERPELADTPLCVLTADANARDKASRLRAMAFLRKPLAVADLLRTAEALSKP